MKYMMFVCVDPEGETYDPAKDNIEEWVSSNDSKGTRITGHQLADVGEARTVRVRNGKKLVTTGPFAETNEWIAGYDLLECKDIEEAIDVASKHPMAQFGRIEVRPFWIEK